MRKWFHNNNKLCLSSNHSFSSVNRLQTLLNELNIKLIFIIFLGHLIKMQIIWELRKLFPINIGYNQRNSRWTIWTHGLTQASIITDLTMINMKYRIQKIVFADLNFDCLNGLLLSIKFSSLHSSRPFQDLGHPLINGIWKKIFAIFQQKCYEREKQFSSNEWKRDPNENWIEFLVLSKLQYNAFLTYIQFLKLFDF